MVILAVISTAMAESRTRMHQTTVRFAADLWSELEREAERMGVSAAQYVRDATLARLAYTAGVRGDGGYGTAPEFGPGAAGQETAGTSEAVWAQARLTRHRARRLRAESQSRRQPDLASESGGVQ